MLVRRGHWRIKPALAQHAWENHHPIKWKEATVVDQTRSPTELLLKEAIHILLFTHPPPPLNTDGGLELPGCWMAALKGMEGRGNHRLPGTFSDMLKPEATHLL